MPTNFEYFERPSSAGAPGLQLSVSRHGLFTNNLNNRNYLGPAAIVGVAIDKSHHES
jgi:hypothetical protein